MLRAAHFCSRGYYDETPAAVSAGARRGAAEVTAITEVITLPLRARRGQADPVPVQSASSMPLAPVVAIDARVGTPRTARPISRRRRGLFTLAAPVTVVAALAFGGFGFASPVSAASGSITVPEEQVVAAGGQQAVGSSTSVDTGTITVPEVPDNTLSEVTTQLTSETVVEQVSTEITEQAAAEQLAAEAAAAQAEAQGVDGSARSELTSDGTFIRPVDGSISSPYGYRIHPVLKYRTFHNGVDLADACGTPVRASAAGVVQMAGTKGSYGRRVELTHSTSIVTSYSHLSKISVKVGQKVNQGDIIGYVGATGRATGCHLHFSAEKNGEFINPMTVI